MPLVNCAQGGSTIVTMQIDHQVNSTVALIIIAVTALAAGFLVVHTLQNAALTYKDSNLLLVQVTQ